MGFMDAVKTCFSQYATFTGRARRSEYWYFFLFSTVVNIVLSVIESVLEIPGILSGLYILAALLPGLAVTARRLHDTGRSGWWMLINLIPLVGFIILLIWLVKIGDDGDNAYGANPIAAAA